MITAPTAPSGFVRMNFATSSPTVSRGDSSDDAVAWASSRFVAMTSDTGSVDRTTRRSEEHTSELQSRSDLVCRLLLEKKKKASTAYVDLDQVCLPEVSTGQ